MLRIPKRLLKRTLMAAALVAAAGLTTLGGASEAQARGCGGYGYGGGHGGGYGRGGGGYSVGYGGGYGGGYGYGPRPVVVARPYVPINYGHPRHYGARYGSGYRGGYHGGSGITIGFGF